MSNPDAKQLFSLLYASTGQKPKAGATERAIETYARADAGFKASEVEALLKKAFSITDLRVLSHVLEKTMAIVAEQYSGLRTEELYKSAVAILRQKCDSLPSHTSALIEQDPALDVKYDITPTEDDPDNGSVTLSFVLPGGKGYRLEMHAFTYTEAEDEEEEDDDDEDECDLEVSRGADLTSLDCEIKVYPEGSPEEATSLFQWKEVNSGFYKNVHAVLMSKFEVPEKEAKGIVSVCFMAILTVANAQKLFQYKSEKFMASWKAILCGTLVPWEQLLSAVIEARITDDGFDKEDVSTFQRYARLSRREANKIAEELPSSSSDDEDEEEEDDDYSQDEEPIPAAKKRKRADKV